MNNVFLNRTIQEEVFMEHVLGFVDPKKPHQIYRLQKSVNGLKQALKAWFEKLSSSLFKLDFNQSKVGLPITNLIM